MEMTDNETMPVLIAGCGLSGLSLAAVLRHRKVPFMLFEAGSRYGEAQGYGITLRKWAYEPFLRALDESDIEHAIEGFKRNVAVDAPIGGSGRIEAGITNANTGGSLVPEMARGDEGHIRANRGRIRKWLIERAGEEKVRWQATVADVRVDQRGVMVRLESGERVRGTCLVAADGVHSTGQSTAKHDCIAIKADTE